MLNLTYEYGTPAGNDGRIRRIQDLVVPDRTVSYEFDALGRLASAETTGGAAYPKWCIGWRYDPQSNRLSQRNLNGENRPGGGT